MTEALIARPAVFVDRDGVLNELVADPRSALYESPLDSKDVRLLPGVVEPLLALREAGYLLIGVTNQPAAAKGSVSVDEILAVHSRVVALLCEQGLVLDRWQLCLHHPDGTVPDLTRHCECRKPAPGMLLDAARELQVDLTISFMVGDTDTDIQAGRAAGCRTVLIEQGASSHKRAVGSAADAHVPDLAGAAAVILSGRLARRRRT